VISDQIMYHIPTGDHWSPVTDHWSLGGGRQMAGKKQAAIPPELKKLRDSEPGWGLLS
jgi:hypothetical protein